MSGRLGSAPIRLARSPLLVLIWVGWIVALVLFGAWLAGKDPAVYLAWPPRPHRSEPPPGSTPWTEAFAALALFVLGFLLKRLRSRRRGPVPRKRGTFPVWGWGAVAGLFLFWYLAWTRHAWFAAWQPYTFFPLWLSYILFVNALTTLRKGRCLMTTRPGFFLALFPFSALVWWLFEFLNRFVQNWYYVNVERFDALAYFVHASLSFSTVLPALAGTMEWLAGLPWLAHAMPGPRMHALGVRGTAIVFALASLAMLGMPIRPDWLFPLLWVAPMALFLALQALFGETTVLRPLVRGEWRPLMLAALSGLICGVFWECWNFYSLAKWIYTIPYVRGWRLFEMPLVGYLGYLPFGVFAWALTEWLHRVTGRPRASGASRRRRPRPG